MVSPIKTATVLLSFMNFLCYCISLKVRAFKLRWGDHLSWICQSKIMLMDLIWPSWDSDLQRNMKGIFLKIEYLLLIITLQSFMRQCLHCFQYTDTLTNKYRFSKERKCSSNNFIWIIQNYFSVLFSYMIYVQ